MIGNKMKCHEMLSQTKLKVTLTRQNIKLPFHNTSHAFEPFNPLFHNMSHAFESFNRPFHNMSHAFESFNPPFHNMSHAFESFNPPFTCIPLYGHAN